MKWLFVCFVCTAVGIQQQVFAQTTTTPAPPTTTAAPLLKPRKPVTCGSFSTNIGEYTTNYDSVTNACAALAFREAPAIQRLKDHNINVQRFISLDNMRRYARYNTQLSANTTIPVAQKNQRMQDEKKIVDDAIAAYKTTADQYLAVINDLASKLDSTSVMQECQTLAQTGFVNQISDANTLVAVPKRICDELNSILGKYEQSMNAAYRKIGATPPYTR